MERKITVAKGQNKLTVAASTAQSVEIINRAGQVVSRVKSDQITVPQIFYLEEGEYKIVTDGRIKDVKAEAEEVEDVVDLPELTRLVLTSDAPDLHMVDGTPEILADGQSFTTITIQKLNAQGEPLRRAKDNDEIFLRTNAGVIKDAEGTQEIRNLKLKKGVGAFRLYSEERKRLATVKVISANPTLQNTSIDIEFF